jgi:hypothetical protein
MTGTVGSKRKTIRSADEIPGSFASEDDERKWWAQHELGSEVLEQLRPTWRDIKDAWPVDLSAADLREVEFPLSIARNHLSLVRRRRKDSNKPKNSTIEHAAVCIVFSAAAVEAGINLYLVAPTLLVRGERFRRFFASVIRRDIHSMSIWYKFSLLEETAASTLGSDLVDSIKQLLERRDTLVHAASAFDKQGHQQIAPGQDSIKPSSHTRLDGPSFDDIDRANDYYRSASAFLRELRLVPPTTDTPTLDKTKRSVQTN